MDEDLMSKKELLELTGISYGQLYRWKRKNLIPEDWFIRKATFTGQETFFPKRKILARIDRIKNMKDDLSLDELADVFSPQPAQLRMEIEEVLKRNIVTKFAIDLFLEGHRGAIEMSFVDVLSVYVADAALRTGNITREEAQVVIHAVEEHFDKFQGRSCELLFVRNLGVGVCLLVQSPTELYVESTSRVVVRLLVAACIEELKMMLP